MESLKIAEGINNSSKFQICSYFTILRLMAYFTKDVHISLLTLHNTHSLHNKQNTGQRGAKP